MYYSLLFRHEFAWCVWRLSTAHSRDDFKRKQCLFGGCETTETLGGGAQCECGSKTKKAMKRIGAEEGERWGRRNEEGDAWICYETVGKIKQPLNIQSNYFWLVTYIYYCHGSKHLKKKIDRKMSERFMKHDNFLGFFTNLRRITNLQQTAAAIGLFSLQVSQVSHGGILGAREIKGKVFSVGWLHCGDK